MQFILNLWQRITAQKPSQEPNWKTRCALAELRAQTAEHNAAQWEMKFNLALETNEAQALRNHTLNAQLHASAENREFLVQRLTQVSRFWNVHQGLLTVSNGEIILTPYCMN